MCIIEQVEMDSDDYYSMQNFQNRIPLGKPKKNDILRQHYFYHHNACWIKYVYMYIIEQVEMDSDGNYSMQNFQNRIPLGKPKKVNS